MSLQSINIDFSGEMKTIQGDVRMQGFGDAFKKAVIACLVVWLLGALSAIVPFIGWTAPFIFFALGPLAGVATYFMDRHEVKRVETQAICPQCDTSFAINESNFKPPMYGCCPECRTSYRVDI
ncbi:MAG: hypothetical protein V4655_03750 [Bdellovibrionota bacterium]